MTELGESFTRLYVTPKPDLDQPCVVAFPKFGFTKKYSSKLTFFSNNGSDYVFITVLLF